MAPTPWPNADLAPEATCGLLTERTDLLLDSVRELDDAAVREPSLLPDWTRAHVLTHLARNADALRNLCHWARTGEETPMYPSKQQRNADIEAGANRTAAELCDDLAARSQALADAFEAMPVERWAAEVRQRPELVRPAWQIPMLRLTEIELHHFDLRLGHPPESWPLPWVRNALTDVVRDLDERAGEPLTLRDAETDRSYGTPGGRTVSGTAATLLAWVTGRGDGTGLDSDPAGPLPALGPWR